MAVRIVDAFRYAFGENNEHALAAMRKRHEELMATDPDYRAQEEARCREYERIFALPAPEGLKRIEPERMAEMMRDGWMQPMTFNEDPPVCPCGDRVFGEHCQCGSVPRSECTIKASDLDAGRHATEAMARSLRETAPIAYARCLDIGEPEYHDIGRAEIQRAEANLEWFRLHWADILAMALGEKEHGHVFEDWSTDSNPLRGDICGKCGTSRMAIEDGYAPLICPMKDGTEHNRERLSDAETSGEIGRRMRELMRQEGKVPPEPIKDTPDEPMF